MTSIRWPIAVVSLVVSLFLLFGGYFAYQKFQIESPMEKAISQTSHIRDYSLQIQPEKITVRLMAKPSFSLQQDYIPLRRKLTDLADDRKLSLKLEDKAGGELKEAWNRMNFGVKEGIALQRYTQIPQAVSKEADTKGIRSHVMMDDRYLYIELRQGNQWLYRVLPLHKPASEVKDNG
ncbi:hypothetical protein [Salinithrix halophila]|uniref:Uncharacterized protein n=1 Tax=Salinithrix halophila TaxID=1485204 RepID=A0ABV8JI39_9BACL